MTRSQLNRAAREGRLPVRVPETTGRGRRTLVNIAGIPPKEDPPAGWLSTAKAAAAWGVSQFAVRDWCYAGLVDAVQVEGRWWIAPGATRPTPPRAKPVFSGPGVSIALAATELGLPESAVRSAVKSGEVPSVLIGRRRRVELDDVAAWVESKRPGS